MKNPTLNEIEMLYEQCNVPVNGNKVRETINPGRLNACLNTNFSNIYGKCQISNLTGFTKTRK